MGEKTIRWTYEYSSMGGYDCMTDSIDICLDGETLVSLDMANFGQDPCDYTFVAPKHATKIAETIVAALNEKGIR